MQQIITSLLDIENTISRLITKSEEIRKEYGSKFKNQQQLVDTISEKIDESLHEINGHIGFLRNDIELLKKYIEFKEAFELFTNEELLKLIDNENITAADKNQIVKEKNISHGDLLKKINLLKKQWNIEFNNISYQKVLQRLTISQ